MNDTSKTIISMLPERIIIADRWGDLSERTERVLAQCAETSARASTAIQASEKACAEAREIIQHMKMPAHSETREH